ncbi:MAG TPA: GDSL-type esterase/lipase family protein [Thermoanaerobaculia bacterium]|nr:GDSL-type esterase/lipase family protein [Thermoanaerobaculia bacterium]
MRKAVARLLLLAVSLGLSLLVAELAVRIVRPQAVTLVSQGLYEPDPPRRYRLQPGFHGTVTNRVEFDTPVAINRAGLRGPEVGPRRPGTFRVLALGDSFTFGVGARQEETYPARLEESMRARGIQTEVLNAGAPGFGVPDAAAWYEAHGQALQPDLVLLAVFMANDLQDAAPGSPKVAAADGYLAVPGESGGLRRWLYYNSHLFVLFKTSVLEGPIRSRLGLKEPHARREQREELSLYSAQPSEMIRGGAAATERAIAELARTAAERKTPVAAILIPSLLQVDPVAWKARFSGLGVDPAGYDPDRPTRLFEEMFRRHGVPVYDLTGSFRLAIRDGEPVYYPIDQHLTPEGYARMARFLAEHLTKGGLLPESASDTAPRLYGTAE